MRPVLRNALELPAAGWFETLLPDFALAVSFFTALAYAVLGRRLGHQRPAAVVAVAIGLALSVGLVSWEYAHRWSVRDLGPVAVGFALIILAGVIYQAIRGVGGGWAGAGIAFGASLLAGWTLGVDWPVNTGVVQTLIIAALLVGVLSFLIHRHGHQWLPQHPSAERARVAHDMRDLYQDRRLGDWLRGGLSRLREESRWLGRRPDLAGDVMRQLRRLLPAEGHLTERLSQLRERAYVLRAGHVARIREIERDVAKMSPQEQRRISRGLRLRYKELRLDARLERLDQSVAETERRIRDLTRAAERCLAAHEYRQVPGLLDEAVKLQDHNARLFNVIERTEARLRAAAKRVAKETPTVEGP